MNCCFAGDPSLLPDESVELVTKTVEGLHLISASSCLVFFVLLLLEKGFMILKSNIYLIIINVLVHGCVIIVHQFLQMPKSLLLQPFKGLHLVVV